MEEAGSEVEWPWREVKKWSGSVECVKEGGRVDEWSGSSGRYRYGG